VQENANATGHGILNAEFIGSRAKHKRAKVAVRHVKCCAAIAPVSRCV
jgi:hypothetical protein